MGLLVGAALVVASVIAFWFALPRDGQVRGYLRSDTVQSYYAVIILGAFVVGLLNVVVGLVSLFS